VTPFRSELRFASFVTYCPRGDGEEIRNSRTLMRQVKENRVLRSTRESASAFMARRVREIGPAFIPEFLGPEVVLVPVPRSTLQKPGALWPADELAGTLSAEGLGRGVLRCLTRTEAVLKAATAAPNERPRAETHFDSLALADPLALPPVITLVDDVITRGAQMLGAAWRVWAARPDITVRGFAFIRTISEADNFETIRTPCTGRSTSGKGSASAHLEREQFRAGDPGQIG
jgi:hypothetical protein